MKSIILVISLFIIITGCSEINIQQESKSELSPQLVPTDTGEWFVYKYLVKSWPATVPPFDPKEYKLIYALENNFNYWRIIDDRVVMSNDDNKIIAFDLIKSDGELKLASETGDNFTYFSKISNDSLQIQLSSIIKFEVFLTKVTVPSSGL